MGCQRNSSMRGSPGISPWSYHNLNSYNSTKFPCWTHKHVWEIHTLKHLKVGLLRQVGEEEREKSRDRCHRCSRKLTVGLEEQRDTECSCLSGQYRLWLNPATWAETVCRDAATVTWRLPLPGKKKKKTHRARPHSPRPPRASSRPQKNP